MTFTGSGTATQVGLTTLDSILRAVRSIAVQTPGQSNALFTWDVRSHLCDQYMIYMIGMSTLNTDALFHPDVEHSCDQSIFAESVVVFASQHLVSEVSLNICHFSPQNYLICNHNCYLIMACGQMYNGCWVVNPEFSREPCSQISKVHPMCDLHHMILSASAV